MCARRRPPGHHLALMLWLWAGIGSAHAQLPDSHDGPAAAPRAAPVDPEALQTVSPGPPPPLPPTDPTPPPASVPEPPPNYRIPPAPPGARYPGLEDLLPGETPQQGEHELRLPVSVGTRLRVLSSDLEALGSRGGGGTTNGLLSIVTGGLSIALGAIQDDRAFANFLYVFGGATILRGGVDMLLSPDPSAVALAYTHMPMRDAYEVRARLRFGERALSDLARSYRLTRILDGSLSLAAGVAIVPLVLLPNDLAFDGPLDVFVVVGAGVSIVSGLIALLTPSEAERRAAAYAQLKRTLRKRPVRRSVRLGLRRTPGGASLTARGAF